jgi:hypothetical protein
VKCRPSYEGGVGMNKLFIDNNGNHWHRCEWCRKAESCNQECTRGGPYDCYGPDEVDSEGCLPGGYCCTECYNHDGRRCQVYGGSLRK